MASPLLSGVVTNEMFIKSGWYTLRRNHINNGSSIVLLHELCINLSLVIDVGYVELVHAICESLTTIS